MQLLHERVERSLLKIFLVVAGTIALLTFGGWFGVRMYRQGQEHRLQDQARTLMERGDFRGAAAPAQRAYVLDPKSAETTRLLARISDYANSRTALDYWRGAADLGRNAKADVLAWAKSAIRFREAVIAETALSRLAGSAENSAEYHALRGDIALLRGNVKQYEVEVERAQKIDPGNRDYALALGTLHTADNDHHAQGMQELEALAQNDAGRHEAIRRLAEDAVRRHEWPRAVEQGRRLEGLTDRTFSDRLLALTALQGANDAALEAALVQLESDSANDPEKIAALMSWLTAAGRPADVLRWSAGLPPELLREKTVPLAFTDALVATHDWAGLQKFLARTGWGPADYMRCAFLAKAARELNQTDEFARQWSEAARKVNARAEQALLLAQTAQKWGWQNEAVELLWLATKDPAKADRTLAALYRYFSRKGETPELYRVLLHLLELHPRDPAIQNNAAQLALLLNYDTERAHRLAREVYQAQPKNADFAATCAFSLWRQGELKKARQILDQLPENERNRPAVAAYYGAILAANGDRETAQTFLALGERAPLLPEEKAMLTKARQETMAR